MLFAHDFPNGGLMAEGRKVLVFGSLNMDLVVKTEQVPEGGQTLTGQEFITIPGGKGANQAVAISKMGCGAAMVGRVGKDGFGEEMVANLERNGVDTSHVKCEASVSSGIAMIIVEASGENRILIVPGANGKVGIEDVDHAAPLFDQASLLVMQFEVDLEAVKYAAVLARKKGIPVLVNTAPPAMPPEGLLEMVDYLVLNEHEATFITGQPVSDPQSAETAAKLLLAKGPRVVMVTLGAQGVVYATGEIAKHIPAFKVKAVDTTAAGDAFIGGFAAALGWESSLEEKIRFANAAGALAATKLGAQSSIPSLEEVQSFLQGK
jgi:ribokinase